MNELTLMGLSHLFVTVFLSGFATHVVSPALTDVTMLAVCPGRDECSLAIYLSGIQQAIIGLGSVVMMPVIGNLSDKYGRKALLTVPMTLSIIPPAILGYSMETNFFYAYYVFRTLTGLVCEGTVICLAHAYVADSTTEGRASAFGILSGASTGSFLIGTLAARFLSSISTFQVAAFVSILAAVYMKVFLKESIRESDSLTQPILEGGSGINHNDGDNSRSLTQPILEGGSGINRNDGDNSGKPAPGFKKIPSMRDIIYLVKSSTIFLQAMVVAFFFNLEDSGKQVSVLYYLKARFHFAKNQYADLMLIFGAVATISQLLLMPVLAPRVREEVLLSLGLFMSSMGTFLCSIAWSVWAVFSTTLFAIFIAFVLPCMRSIASRQVTPNEQGKAQGCISGISSLANIISPLIFSPLTALFLSEKAPFDFPGFSIMCVSLTGMIAFVQSVMIRPVPPSHKISNSSMDA